MRSVLYERYNNPGLLSFGQLTNKPIEELDQGVKIAVGLSNKLTYVDRNLLYNQISTRPANTPRPHNQLGYIPAYPFGKEREIYWDMKISDEEMLGEFMEELAELEATHGFPVQFSEPVALSVQEEFLFNIHYQAS